MALEAAHHRAIMAQITLSVGLASLLLAVTLRRLRAKHRENDHAVSCRAKAMAPNFNLPFVVEHFAHLHDPDYVCVSIAENKLTVRLFRQKNAWTICQHLVRHILLAPYRTVTRFKRRDDSPNSHSAQ